MHRSVAAITHNFGFAIQHFHFSAVSKLVPWTAEGWRGGPYRSKCNENPEACRPAILAPHFGCGGFLSNSVLPGKWLTKFKWTHGGVYTPLCDMVPHPVKTGCQKNVS